MLFKDTVKLISETFTTNDKGNSIPSLVEKEVFANKNSIRQSEFYQAAATGLKPELMFTIRLTEYSGERKLKYDNTTYDIIRTYEKNTELIELICTGAVV